MQQPPVGVTAVWRHGLAGGGLEPHLLRQVQGPWLPGHSRAMGYQQRAAAAGCERVWEVIIVTAKCYYL